MEKMCAIVMQDRQITTRLLAESLEACKEATMLILERDLQKRKVFSRFVPHFLTAEQIECYCSFIEFVDQDRNVF